MPPAIKINKEWQVVVLDLPFHKTRRTAKRVEHIKIFSGSECPSLPHIILLLHRAYQFMHHLLFHPFTQAPVVESPINIIVELNVMGQDGLHLAHEARCKFLSEYLYRIHPLLSK